MEILYCGDDEQAKLYVLGALDQLGHQANHVSPETAFPGIQNQEVLILSDYPAANIDQSQAEAIERFVSLGGRLLMIGGWASFNGEGNNYYGHPVGNLLPVDLRSQDDRVNQALFIRAPEETRARYSLNWANAPVICGYNAASPKPTARVLVTMVPTTYDGETVAQQDELPLVIAGRHGDGTSVACLTDLAPHWSGNLGDWGEQRLTLSTGRQVGSDYPRFLQLLLEAAA